MSLGPGRQFHPTELLFWNLLGSLNQVQQSAAGPNCTELGSPTYETGFFGDAVRIDANAEAIQAFNVGQIFTNTEGCVEMWTWNDGYTITNGAPSDAVQHTMWSSFRVSGGTQFMYIGYVVGGFWFVIARNGAFTGWGAGVRTPAIMDAGNQEWHHVACSWSMTGAMSGDTMRIYFDGVLADSTTLAIVGMPVLTDGETHYVGLNRNGDQHPFVGRLDNVKVWDFPKTDFTDSMTEEGFSPPPGPAGILPPELFATREPRVEVMDIELVCRTRQTPKIKESRSLKSSDVTASTAQIIVNNSDNAFSLENPRSVFAGTNWLNKSVKIFDRFDTLIWDGLLSEPLVNHKNRTTTIKSKSKLYKWRNEPVVYTSAGNETPASALRNVAAAIGFTDFDTGRLQASDDQQTAAGLVIFVTLLDTDDATFGQVVNRLADFGCADVYEHLGKLRYIHAVDDVARPGVTLGECDLLQEVKVKQDTLTIINDYAIGFTGPAVVTDATAGAGNIGAASRSRNGVFQNKKIPGDVDAQYTIPNTVAAQYLGECWIKRTNMDLLTRPRSRLEIDIEIELEHRVWVDLTSEFSLTYGREGWTNKAFRVIAFTRDDTKRRITVTALEWET